MDVIVNIVGFLITLGLLVTVHEYGHFWAARKMGVKVLRFSVGFGKPLKTWQDRFGTEFAIASIPLGGYVKMVDEREGSIDEADLPYAFNRKSASAKVFIAAAGPIANFLFAILAYMILSMVGVTEVLPKVGEVQQDKPAAIAGLQSGSIIKEIDGQSVSSWREVTWALFDRVGETGDIKLMTDKGSVSIPVQKWMASEDAPQPLQSLGIRPFFPEVSAIIARIETGSAAEQAGLQIGDEIVRAQGESIEHWMALVDLIKASPGERVVLEVNRENTLRKIEVYPASRDVNGVTQGFLGVGPQIPEYPEELIVVDRKNPFSALYSAVIETGQMIVRILDSLWKMVEGLLSVKNLSGPITIAKVAGASVSSGFESFVGFLAYVSIMLGVVNLLPIPVLDGGHIVIHTIEGVIKRPIPEKIQVFGIQIGLALLFFVMAIAFYNDIARL